ncbi:MAG: ornithine cyclodeaminase family protein [Sandaracinaceae bacterium]
MSTRILTRADVESLLEIEGAVHAVEGAFEAHGLGRARMPAKVYLDLPEHDGDFRAMPSFMDGSAGVKWVNSHPKNPERHQLPSVMGVYILSDPATAAPLAVLDATWITAVRTGAAAAVASKHLAKQGARTIGFVGCGVQARTMLAAHRVYFDDLEVLGADVFADAAQRFATEVGGRAVTLREACGCDIVCCATPVRTPVVQRAWIQPGAHVNAMGADGPGKQELEADILLHGRVFIDDWDQATHSGEVNVPLHAGTLSRDDIAGTIGEVVAKKIAGRSAQDQITVFDSTGLAIQDLAVARAAYEASLEKGVGLEVPLVG